MPKMASLVRLAYDSAYDLKPAKKNYSEPKIYDAGGDTSQRWYVYYSFRNPATGKLERQPMVDTGVNQYKDVRSRKKAIKNLREAVASILEQGLYNPFTDEADNPTEKARLLNIPQAVEFAITIKKNTLEETSFRGFKSNIKQFEKYLLENGYRNRLMTSVTESAIIDYLNAVLIRTSARTRNNARSDISSFYTLLRDNRIVPANLVEGINKMTAIPTRHKSFTPEQKKQLLERIFEAKPYLGLYIMVISISVVRPIEANRLLIADVDLRDRKLYFRAKNQKVKIKIIPDILARHFPDLSGFDRKAHLFGYRKLGQELSGKASSHQRDYGKMFREIKKEFGMGDEYTLYSWRHTYITEMYKSLRAEGNAPFEAKTKLMLITGHSSMKALESYLREIDAELPEDYSHLLK